jgi:hypothetical protein
MTSIPIVSRLPYFLPRLPFFDRFSRLTKPPDLHTLWLAPQRLPDFVQESPVAMRYLELLGPLAWDRFPERNLQRNWGQATVPLSAFAGACLIKIDQQIGSLARLRTYLVEHPPLTWLLGFPLKRSHTCPTAADVEVSLPTYRHFTRMLRTTPNTAFQFLLSSSVATLQAEFQSRSPLPSPFGESISLDTKHILAWVKENNPKAYASERFNKDKQPKGDPDCKLGCKRRRNQKAAKEPPPTPTSNPIPAEKLKIGEFYWGYASGVVATKVPGWGEYVLAELTQPFDRSDVSYFFPLMAQLEHRLGGRPRFGAFDAAFDAFYVYEYFYNAQGFAAVPLVEKGKCKKRSFSPEGLPLCEAGKPMPLKFVYQDRTTNLYEHQRGKYVCPLLFPENSGETCPISHKNWGKGGCTTTMATSIGARLRYTLDRDSDTYKEVYKQRTATERINSQAKELGIERPILRNGQAIGNLNTLIYVLINLRAFQRLRNRRAVP